ncbi:MAG TPA: undecaprenyl-diphosphate phosphatase [Arcobacter sp.]|jgi:undecaprenyl-diphosphatase|nr:undecaprenyl-diphosphate phosphatase [Arcobacter sp.]
MGIFESIILGIIEGFTEFLPISSTGHLIVASEALGIDQTKVTKAYEVIIQFAAILAVIFTYKDKFHPSKINLWIKICLAFIPIGAVGYTFADQIKAMFDITIVAWMFIIGGVIFLIVEKYYKEDEHKIDDIEKVSYKQAMWIGFAQIFALIPGTSRAGSTIIGAMLVGLNRKASAEFSFLLALPVMSATTAYDLLKHYQDFSGANLIVLGVGFVTAFIVAYLTMKLFLVFLQRFTFVAFGIYRILFGSILLLWFI